MANQKAGAKGRKIGRNKQFCEMYRLQGRREKNKALKQARHQKRMVRKQLKLAKRHNNDTI